ncbi:MAG: BCD family MFS transporter [Kamptonema sp. SIO4C4]|nr:BCD family MFS transporter [Kamptonema sp. SIO4C4]
MATPDFVENPSYTPQPKPINLFNVFRLGLFNLGLGLMAVLTVAVLNRVMISEFNIPAWITAGAVAIQYFVSPARVWFGQLSDAKPLFGLHRTGYVRLGAIVAGIAVFCAVQVAWQLGMVSESGWVWNAPTLLWTVGLGLVFLVYGFAIASCSVPFTALLVDISDESNRPKIVPIVWSMLMVGIVIGGITGGIWGKTFIEESSVTLNDLYFPLNLLFIVVPIVFIGLAFIATWGIEKKYSYYSIRSSAQDREDSITLGNALRILTQSRQTAIFFVFLLALTMGLFLQEAVLEPYGGDVFGMPIGETTQLNAAWGVGILIGYSTTGFLVVPRLGKKLTTRIGCLAVAFCFLLIIFSGLTENPQILQAAMLIFGVAAGVATIGGICLMLDLTTAETAGTFIGAWGLSQSLARGLSILFGGILLDVGKVFFNTPFFAYALVFAVEGLIMLGATVLLNRVDVNEFQENVGNALQTVMEGDLDG